MEEPSWMSSETRSPRGVYYMNSQRRSNNEFKELNAAKKDLRNDLKPVVNNIEEMEQETRNFHKSACRNGLRN
jgi:hypothetical protein